MPKKKTSDKIESEKVSDFKNEFTRLKEELDEHEKNIENLKQEISTLKNTIKLGSIAQNKNPGKTKE